MIHRTSLLFFLLITVINAERYYLTQDYQLLVQNPNEGPIDLSKSSNSDILAIATYSADMNTTGWMIYNAEVNTASPDWEQFYSIGYMEGYLAYETIWFARYDLDYILADYPEQFATFIQNQTTWFDFMIRFHPQDPYWDLVNTTRAQLYGMYQGYNDAINQTNRPDLYLNFTNFYMVTYWADLFGAISSNVNSTVVNAPRCSFLLKMTETELFASHDSWNFFDTMLKIFRKLSFNLQNPLVKTKQMSYSGMPGSVPSQDDFYMLDNGRLVSETSLINNNVTNTEYLHADSLPYWIRITIANLAYDTQQTWTDMFFKYRSGTYNNQWLIVNFDEYNQGKANLSNLTNVIWIVEEFYGYTSQQDVTQELFVPQGYVASYNVPYSPQIQNISGDPTNYTNDTRYYLFKKYAPGIQTLDDFKFVMRLNNISDSNDYCEAIASRCDLSSNSPFPFPFGAIDSKVTSDSLIYQQEAWVIAGPTTEQDIAPFDWENWPQFNQSRVGMPSVFNFSWIFLAAEPNYNDRQFEMMIE
jgi:hypothetical protein